MNLRIFKLMRNSFASAVLLLGASGASHAGTLLGSGTLDVANDLTRIFTTGGETWEFLDLTSTQGDRPSEALATYSPRGFMWSGITEVNELLMAFNMGPLPPFSGGQVIFPVADPADIAHFNAVLGSTFAGLNASGWVDDGLANGTTGIVNVRALNTTGFPWPPTSDMFTNSVGDDNGANYTNTGVFIFRPEPNGVIPEPTTLAIFGLGLAGLGFSRRRKAA